MTLLWNFKAMKGRQLLWTAVFSWTVFVLTLLGNQVAGESTTVLTTMSATIKLETTSSPTTSSPTKEATENSSITASTPATPTVSSENSQTTNKNHTTNTTSSPTIVSKLTSTTMNQTTQPSTTQNVLHVANKTNATVTSTIFPTSTEKPMFSDSSTPMKTDSISVQPSLTCMDIKEVTNKKVICLELNQPYSCQKFVQEKGTHLAAVICEKNQITCKILLTESSVNSKCILILEDDKKEMKGTRGLDAVLQENKSTLEKQAITPHEQEVIGNHIQKPPSRKTLIALVTSGLLLAFLGLTAYFLMKRRSWSPMGERLGEDPYYTENGSHGNIVASHEQSDLQDKPNLNGGSRENGTGQPASKNGHSTRPHVVADTEL